MVDYRALFEELTTTSYGQQRRLPGASEVKIFYGINSYGELRLSFMSSVLPPKIDSTKEIKVLTFMESAHTYWLYFDLINDDARPMFFALCEDLSKVVADLKDAEEALLALKNRFFAWQNMFKHERVKLTDEQVVGLIGELTFLKKYLIPKVGIESAIDAWSGVEGANKDFSTKDTWYEIKTASLNTNNIKINSITQLSSPVTGFLVVFRYETMSGEYDDAESNPFALFQGIMRLMRDDDTRTKYIAKLSKLGFDVTGNSYQKKYRIDSMTFYKVDDLFPRLRETDIKYPEIDKVTYTLLINSLERFKVEEDRDANA